MEKMFTTEAEYFNDYFVLDLQTNKPKKQMTAKQIKSLA
jgi:hypothetical protein